MLHDMTPERQLSPQTAARGPGPPSGPPDARHLGTGRQPPTPCWELPAAPALLLGPGPHQPVGFTVPLAFTIPF